MFESDKFQAFSFETGIIIISGDPKLNDELAANNKWFLFRRTGNLAVFASTDIGRQLDKEGLPGHIIKFIAVHQHEVL